MTELQRLTLWCVMHIVWGKVGVGTKWEEIPRSTVSTVRNWSSSSWPLQSTGAPCATVPRPPTNDEVSTERPPRGSRTEGVLLWGPITESAPSRLFSCFQLEDFLMQIDSLLAKGKQLLGSSPKYALFFPGCKEQWALFRLTELRKHRKNRNRQLDYEVLCVTGWIERMRGQYQLEREQSVQIWLCRFVHA